MTVYVVTNTGLSKGVIEAVFSSNEKACDYITQNPYSSFILTEHEVDKYCAVKTHTNT